MSNTLGGRKEEIDLDGIDFCWIANHQASVSRMQNKCQQITIPNTVFRVAENEPISD